jgi:hypothetical protein
MLQDEIYMEELRNKPAAKKRYSAMKKYFSYTKQVNKTLTLPCMVDFDGKKQTAFSNGYSLVVTSESCGEMELFSRPEDYLKVNNIIIYDGDTNEINFSKVIADAKSKGYKAQKSEIEQNDLYKYVLYYRGSYYKIGLLDITYSIINDGNSSKIWHFDGKQFSSLIIKTSIGSCLLLPVKYVKENDINHEVTVINAE